jgi:translation initiation factor eIF-2B subunit delta
VSHLEPPKKPDTEAHKDLHPAVLKLGVLFSQYVIVGSNARCVALLKTFSQVIQDHRAPSSASFIRHVQKHLDPHIAFLLSVRSLSLSVRECIRWLKKSVADLVASNPSDGEARQILQDQIAHFIRERITMADKLIVQYAPVVDGDVIVTFAASSVVEQVLLEAKKRDVKFRVIVVDGRPLLEGKILVKKLSACGIPCSYALVSSVYTMLKSATKVMMGAHAVLFNGSVYSRIGTAAVAMSASDSKVPVMICCETYKFVNRTQVDSLVMNEKGDPTDLETAESKGWEQQPNLNITNLMYDVTPAKFISLVVTEIGIIPATSAPVVRVFLSCQYHVLNLLLLDLERVQVRLLKRFLFIYTNSCY